MALTLPDQARTELDQLLRQLVQQVQEVMATQGRLRGLLAANQLITADLTPPAVLRHIAEAARELIGARYAAVGVVAPAGGLTEFVHVGMPEDVVERIRNLPEGKGLLGIVIEGAQPIRLRDIGGDPRSAGFPPGHPPMSSFLGVPIRVRNEVVGNLYLTESLKSEFTGEDEEVAKALAAAAAVAIDHARRHETTRPRGEWLQASAAITPDLPSAEVAAGEGTEHLEERERIAADLHDHVIQRLFAAGLSLQSVAAAVGGGRAGERLAATIDDLDETISQIRTTIFRLQHVTQRANRSVRGGILDVVADLVPALGFQPSLRFEGALEQAAGDDIVEDLLAVLREALTNVVRHASARSVTVKIGADAERLVLRVQDDGIGIASDRASGLANMRRRAERHGGTLTVSRREPSGTLLCWQVPFGSVRPGSVGPTQR